MGRVTQRHPVLTIAGTSHTRRPDQLAVEEPLEIRLDGVSYQVTMRTPGDDIDLLHGLLNAEQVITEADQVVLARYCAGTGPDGLNTYNVIDVTLGPGARTPELTERRAVVTSSACGICGTASIDKVRRQTRFRPDPDVAIPLDLVRAVPVLLRERQRGFDTTGGLHGAGLIGLDGSVAVVREDVGRHNAVDKVIGWAVRQHRLPLSRMILGVSGRASFELVQKAIMAGIPALVAISAPSSLAVELADDAGMTLIGFVRGDRLNVYAGADRLTIPA